MSRRISRALLGVVVSALAAVAVAPAHAATLTQTYSCEFPLIADRPVTLDLEANIPPTAHVGVELDPIDVRATIQTDDALWQFMQLVRGAKFTGDATVRVRFSGSGTDRAVNVPVAFSPVTMPPAPGPITFDASGAISGLVFAAPGPVAVTSERLSMNLSAVRADGTAIRIPGVGPDTDGDPNTFDIACALAPADQSTTLGVIDVDGAVPDDLEAPTAPGIPVVGDITRTSARVSWAASTDDVGVWRYVVAVEGGTTRTVTVPGNETSTTLSDLEPGTDYRVRVQARDRVNLSEPSGETVFRTAADTEPPTRPAGLTATARTATTVMLGWSPSTDDVGVVGYDVYRDGVKVATASSTNAAVANLQPATEYVFTVRARDEAGNLSPFSDGLTVRTAAVDEEPARGPRQTYRCDYPLIAGQPMTIEVVTEIPSTWPDGVPTAPFRVTVNATAGGDTGNGLSLVQAASLEGTVTLSSTVTASGLDLPILIPTVIERTTLPSGPGPVEFVARGATPSLVFPNPGAARFSVERLNLNLRLKKADGSNIVMSALPGVPDSDGVPETFDVPCALDPVEQLTPLIELTVVSGDQDVEPPSTPGTPVVISPGDLPPTTAKISWAPSTDNVGVSRYEVNVGGQVIVVPGSVTTANLTGLVPGTEYRVTVRAVDGAGNTSDLSDPLTLFNRVVQGPTKPTNLTATATPTTVTLKWTASTDDVGVVGYDVFRGSTKVTTVTGTTATVSGLTPDTAYTFTVAARDTEGLTSPSSDPLTLTTPRASDASVKYAYALTGTSHLKTLTRGPVPLTGAFAAELTVATGAFTGDLSLNNTRARLIALGFVPVTADLAFVMTSKTTGKLEGGAATATARFKVRLPKLYLFGSIPIAGGASCQTKTASVANLASEGTFNPLTGGRLQGTYALSDLTGCGALTSFISPLTKGTGNTIDIALTPQA